MDKITEICNSLRKFDTILTSFTRVPTDENIGLYENWVDCRYEIEKIVKEYKELEGQGLLLRLPCKVGDFVYQIANQRDNFTDEEYKIVVATSFRLDMISNIGKTVFLTREEAEQVLANMGV